jgi:hypothetical protein
MSPARHREIGELAGEEAGRLRPPGLFLSNHYLRTFQSYDMIDYMIGALVVQSDEWETI